MFYLNFQFMLSTFDLFLFSVFLGILSIPLFPNKILFPAVIILSLINALRTFYTFQYWNNNVWFNLSLYLLLLVISSLFYNLSFMTRIFYCGIYYVVTLVSELLVLFFSTRFFMVMYDNTNSIQLIFGNTVTFLFKIVIIALILILFKRNKTPLSFKPIPILLSIAWIPILSVFILYKFSILAIQHSENLDWDIFIIILGIIYLNIAILLIYGKMIDSYSITAKNEAIKFTLSEHNKNYNQFKKNQQSMKYIQHDLKNYLSVIHGYLKSDENLKATKSLEEKLEDLNNLSIKSYTPHMYMSIEKGTTLPLKKGPPRSRNRSYSSPSCNVFFQ